jgi:branched-chain amino acid transport system ATP-binding protein
MARALAGRPKLILLDEPAGGLNHQGVEELAGFIQSLRDRRGITVLLVEHHMGLVMSVSDVVVALNFGRKITEGKPTDVQKHPEVVAAYLGAAA